MKWWRLAAEQGHASAQDYLGTMYERGLGVVANRVIALTLFHLAAVKDRWGNGQASLNRARLAQRLSSQEMAAARTLTYEMAQPKNLLVALDRYVLKTTSEVMVAP